MNRLLIVLILLTGCVHKEAIQEPPKVQRTTVYRYISEQCQPGQEERLREALKSAREWKRYAESLEKLPAAKTTHEINP
ncbi:hypothetical protein M3M50_10750 [Pseudomonas bijieensis]|uniref:hypothetical protein n=1 Tax=Pseudomonas bijieensis TaxID=2681983 RepID=UPI00200C3231|nr:hypothetical protein [Pseudomonas bijieensis]UQI33077.1 hypothetical protein M3M50_10750 [Pseudomonas bijieensis]